MYVIVNVHTVGQWVNVIVNVVRITLYVTLYVSEAARQQLTQCRILLIVSLANGTKIAGFKFPGLGSMCCAHNRTFYSLP